MCDCRLVLVKIMFPPDTIVMALIKEIKHKVTFSSGQDYFLLGVDVLESTWVELLQLALQIRLHFGQILQGRALRYLIGHCFFLLFLV